MDVNWYPYCSEDEFPDSLHSHQQYYKHYCVQHKQKPFTLDFSGLSVLFDNVITTLKEMMESGTKAGFSYRNVFPNALLGVEEGEYKIDKCELIKAARTDENHNEALSLWGYLTGYELSQYYFKSVIILTQWCRTIIKPFPKSSKMIPSVHSVSCLNDDSFSGTCFHFFIDHLFGM